MGFQTLLLLLFSSIALISATMVIASKNPIHSVVFLILVFCNATGLLLLLKIEFIAMMFLIIYVGAIAVLFLFVVMMLNIKINELSENWLRYIPIGTVISIIFLLEIFLILFQNARLDQGLFEASLQIGAFQNGTIEQNVHYNGLITLYDQLYMSQGTNEKVWSALIDPITNIQSLGFLIYTYYFYYFIMASLILLVAMIGAIVLTMHKRQKAFRKQLIYKQIARNFTDAIRYAK